MKKVYTCFCTDIIHEGHLNIINEAKKYGEVYVGILTDEAMIKFDRFPTITFDERIELVKKIGGIKDILIQDKIMYDDIIKTLRPDYVIHGDNWKSGKLKPIRDNVERALNEYGGKIIDVPYTYSERVKRIDAQIKEKLAMPEYRRKRLK